MQRGWMFSCLLWSFFMCAQSVNVLHDVWTGKEGRHGLLGLFGAVCCLIAVVTAPISVLGFCTTFYVDSAGITQRTPCLAPLLVKWEDIEALHLRIYGLQIKVKNRRKPLHISIHLDDFNALWKTIEESSGKRVK